jgi:hypothetical protein
LLAAACFQPASTEQVSDDSSGYSTGRRGSSAGGGSGGRSSTADASSGQSTGAPLGSGTGIGSSGASSGSSAGGSSGGSSGGGIGGGLSDGGTYLCKGVAEPPLPVNCPSGDLGVSSQLVDVLDCTTIDGAAVEALDPNGVPISGSAATSSATDGTFVVCGPSETPFSVQMTAAGYPITYLAELKAISVQDILQIGMLSTSSLQVIAQLIPGGVDMTKGIVLVKVSNALECDVTTAGWSIGIELPDGGDLPDGGYQLVYSGAGGLPAAGLTETSTAGAAIFYDIDPLLSDFFVITYDNPDAGASCQPQDVEYGFTGRIYVAGGAVSAFPIFLP